MKLSVIVPVYGVEKYITRCAQSLLEQSYPDKEIIFVDDASKDGSIAILEDVLHRSSTPVTILHHSTNRGLAAARKTGLDAATGEYIVSVDSDDYLEKDALSILAEKAEETKADIVRMDCLLEWTDRHHHYSGPWSDDPKEYSKILLSGRALPGVCLHMIRRSLYAQTGYYPIEGLNYGEDYVVTPRLCWSAERIARVHQALYHYTQTNDASMVHTISQANICNLTQAFDILSSFVQVHPECEETLRAGEWLKKTEHMMLARKSDYPMVDTLPCLPPINTGSMNKFQRIAAQLMAHRFWTLLWMYCRCLEGLIQLKSTIKRPK